KLLLIAEHQVDFRHLGEHLGLGLRGAAGDDDAGFRVLLARPPDCLARLAVLRANPRWQAPYYWSGYILEGDWR
ncbi:MAG TPA: hypothetical protein VLK83_13660, partial [Rhodanobacteraceae bacterium]|nr:hypothetical protein [Rhodanobacteraceae bacterium]